MTDGLLTYRGIASFGTSIEGNPILAWYMAAVGPAATVVGAKSLAAGCATTLYLKAMHRTVGILTLLYLAGAVLPWIHVLWH